jgi:hypothetical protein
MSTLSPFAHFLFAIAPLVFTTALLTCVMSFRIRSRHFATDAPVPRHRLGAALLTELGLSHGEGRRAICGVLSVALPPLGIPLILCAAAAANAFTRHDDFFNGELVPGLVGTFIILSFASVLAGVPFGIAGLLRRERPRWLSATGIFLSLGIFAYLMTVQHLAARNLQ